MENDIKPFICPNKFTQIILIFNTYPANVGNIFSSK